MLGNHGLKHDQRKPVSVVQQLFWKPFLLQQLSWVLRTLFVIFLCAAPPCKMKTAGCKLELPTKTPFHLPGSVNPSLLIHAVISSFSKEWMDVANRNLCWWIPLHDDMIGFKSFCIVLHDNSTICIFLDKLPKTRSKQTEHQNINIIKQYLCLSHRPRGFVALGPWVLKVHQTPWKYVLPREWKLPEKRGAVWARLA